MAQRTHPLLRDTGPLGALVGMPLHTNVVHTSNVFKDGAFTTPYSREECSAYVEHLPEAFMHEGRTIHKKSS